jgi:hypothetical protein
MEMREKLARLERTRSSIFFFYNMASSRKTSTWQGWKAGPEPKQANDATVSFFIPQRALAFRFTTV